MDIITLSSSDDETSTSVSPPKKKIKLHTFPSKTICLDSSDDDEDSKTQTPLLPLPKENGILKLGETAVSSEMTSEIMKHLIADNVHTSVTVENELKIDNTNTDPVEQKLLQFLDKCQETIRTPKLSELFNNVIPKVKGCYNKLKKLNSNLKDLECILDRYLNDQSNVNSATISSRFEQVFRFLKSKITESEDQLLLSGPKRKHLERLEKALRLVNRRIAKLDSAEVNFDDEENSHYLQAAKYKERATKIFKKICEIRKEDPNVGRPLYTKINFTKSKYMQFNKAINKRFRHLDLFPTYYEMNECLRNCAKDKDLNISEEELKAEIKFCFEKFGLSMKQKRSLDLYDVHSDFISGTEDPAQGSEEVSHKLRENYNLGRRKMDEILEKYTRMQESGVDPKVSSDSDDSNVDSD